MAVESETKNTRIILADDKKKAICSYGGINPAVTPPDVVLFKEGIEGMTDANVNFTYLEKSFEITETP